MIGRTKTVWTKERERVIEEEDLGFGWSDVPGREKIKLLSYVVKFITQFSQIWKVKKV
jgi:hypothetical protein